MFTLEQIADIHDRLGTKDNLAAYLRALRDIGVQRYDSYITDGHSEYFGGDDLMLAGPPHHETFVVADTCDRDQFLRYMRQVEEGDIGYVEMSRALASNGVEKWTFDTEHLTITYRDKAGHVLLAEEVD